MDKNAFKDLFSTQAKDYSIFRPSYPNELFHYLNEISEIKNYAWDCGTGNGQAAVALSRYFKNVIATDPSEKQIAEAPKKENIHYQIATAENFTCENKINLTTVAQAFHWFKHDQFADIVKSVSAPGAHLAVWSYAIAHITPDIDKVVDDLYSGILKDYWEKERRHVEDGYQNIYMPFKEVAAPHIDMQADWSLDHLVGYLSTWSALSKYSEKNHHNPMEEIYFELKKAWGNQQTRTVSWPLTLRVWKI